MVQDILPIIDLDICVVLILVIILFLYKSKFNMNDKENKIYITMVSTVILILILEILDKFVLKKQSSSIVTITKLINVLGFAMSPVVPYLYIKYLFQCFNIKVNTKILKIPIIINIILSMLSYKYGYIFWVTDLNSYNRGNLFYIPMTITYLYFIISLVVVLKIKKNINKRGYINLLFFQAIPIIAATLQILFNNLILIWGAVGIAIIIQYIYMQEDLIKYDTLTGVLNRWAFETYFNNKFMKRGKKFSLIYIDVNDFKNINDSYGHNEGDIALIEIANVLRKSFEGIGKIGRMGGDEFIISADSLSERRLNNRINKIYLELDKVNKKKNKNYTLKISLGYKSFNSKYSTLNEYIKEVDALMYEDKAKYKTSNNQF